MDRIHLTGIRSYGYTGALPEEQVLGQWFEVELSLWLDLSQPGHSDRLEDTLDYRAVIQLVQERVQTTRFKLLERLATVIAEEILAMEGVEQVQVRLTKLAAPIPNFTGLVTVEIIRPAQPPGSVR